MVDIQFTMGDLVKNKFLGFAAVISMALFGAKAHAEAARDYISIVGSSTVYPFATVVAEQFGRGGKFKTPKIESTGTGGGIKLFCSGVGVQYPDIANASRPMKKAELAACQKAGVKEITEVKIGYDGIVLAHAKSAEAMELTRREVFLALAKKVPDPSCQECDKLVDNPYKTWNQINPALPNVKIEVLGPPPTSGTRDAFAELALEGGCQTFKWIKAWKEKDEAQYKGICQTVREDGAYIEAGENDNLIVQKLNANPKALGIFGFSFLDQNGDKISAIPMDGIAPDYDTISAQQYPVSRPMFFYVKKAHVGVIPGIEAYVAEFTSEKAMGEEGYLTDKGLIPLPNSERKEVAQNAKSLKNYSM
ncbi:MULTISPECIES: PstS family phosphate ABC transporter substrate-binding protein [Methylocaldum]|uniref:PstS family phosphate ABC transporter substrate-binding protein n=1 Tax=unclassified Methylocaldum TaxID=2622260 RepID=UPI0010EFB8F7|nr:PstS family phosphate ABC transporter substrate-binding protein [Methylocaldum sp. 14B]MBP1152901.1 phosphate transport system substrate-binding protein [Methylocaldum sp. RMAD-M]MDV3242787.1 PstS family phosphate ABC transporter substrate-binding protein [Methylocaldum sp.]